MWYMEYVNLGTLSKETNFGSAKQASELWAEIWQQNLFKPFLTNEKFGKMSAVRLLLLFTMRVND